MGDKATTVKGYLDALPADRAKAISAIRAIIKKNLDPQIKEGIQYGMIGYFVPHSVYPEGYHCNPKEPLPFASVASQKNHMAISLLCIYCDPKFADWFAKAWVATGKKLDMGKGCVRFKTLEDVPLEVVGEAIRRMTLKKFIEGYEKVLPASVKKKRIAKASATKKAPSKKVATKVTKKSSGKSVGAKKKNDS